MDESLKNTLYVLLREKDVPFFDDEEIELYYSKNGNNLNAALYEMLTIKSMDTSLIVPGLTTAETSSYFRRLAYKYRPNNGGILKGS